MKLEFEGIGTHWLIEIFDEVSTSKLDSISLEIQNCVKDFENLYSRFKETSLISELNRNKILLNPSSELIELLKIGEAAKEVSKGHFDIAVGDTLERMGYDKDYSFKSSVLSTQKTSISSDKEKITLNENTRIDLGGIGKGFLIDKIKLYLISKKINYFFINAGGDIYATSNNDLPIEFFLENPLDNNQMIGKILIKDESIAASSPSRRKWTTKNTNIELNHLVDMISKDNVKEIAGVFTNGESALETDVASTCLFVSTANLYEAIAKFFNIEFMIVYADGSFAKSPNYKAELFS